MWCAVWSEAKVEKTTETYIKKILPEEAYDKCVCPRFEYLLKRHGSLILTDKPLYPGYVLIKTDEPERVLQILKSSGRFPVLNMEDFTEHFSSEETSMLDLLCSDNDMISLSIVRKNKDENGRSRAQFLSGPLKDAAEYVNNVDFVKRKAYLNVGYQLHFLYEGETREQLKTEKEVWG